MTESTRPTIPTAIREGEGDRDPAGRGPADHGSDRRRAGRGRITAVEVTLNSKNPFESIAISGGERRARRC